MSIEVQMNTQIQMIDSHKKPYNPPHLINYGEVRSLTQSGSKNADENGMGTMA